MSKRTTTRIILLAAAVAVLIAGTYLLRSVTSTSAASDAGANGLVGDQTAAIGIRPAEIQRRIALFEDRVAAGEDGVATQRYLGLLYSQKARYTDDIPAYFQARDAYENALALHPDHADTIGSLAQVSSAIHDFAAAADYAERAYEADNTQFDALLVLVDVAVALGDYDAAAMRLQELDEALPDQPVIQTRLARLDYINGDATSALEHAATAEQLAEERGLLGADLAFYRTVHGRIALEVGRYDLAAERFGRALAESPDWAIALGGLAEAKAASGQIDEAVALYRRIVDATFDPPFVAALADLLTVQGRTEEAQQLYDAVAAIGRPTGPDGQVHGREYAVIYSDLDVHPELALELAERDLEGRNDVDGHDVVAWALYRNDRLAEARAASDLALRLGTPDAAMLYHAGLISLGLGDTDRGIAELRAALDLSPNFHPLHAGHARALLADLGASSS